MAGRIREEDVKAVRDASPVADVVGERVQLRSAGGGNLKGLCPFHDEKSPSFNVTSARGLYHCFGCGEGGDVISFVMKLDQLSFNEAVEQLAKRARIELRYAEGGYTKRAETSERTRLLEAHAAAAAFYREQLDSPDAKHGREFLSGRGFERGAIEKFGVGYAPGGWDALVKHLRGRGFTDRELLTGGLASDGRRGPIDRFRDRLVWPIADLGGEVIGFGARRLNEDKDSPKYLNTPETPLYKKSSVLYGLDLARRDIAKQERAVVVEGYTDVMACHLAGETTAIASCGTAFGEEHIKILRRLIADRNQFLGCEVVFTFDGDSAGQKAALRAFLEDQRWVMQTFVAVQPDGLDPCDLRAQRGDAAIPELISKRVPLFEFAIKSRLRDFDLDSAEGRVRALRATAPDVASIRDQALRPEYVRRLSGWLGMEERTVQSEVRRAGPRRPSASGAGAGAGANSGAGAGSGSAGTASSGQNRGSGGYDGRDGASGAGGYGGQAGQGGQGGHGGQGGPGGAGGRRNSVPAQGYSSAQSQPQQYSQSRPYSQQAQSAAQQQAVSRQQSRPSTSGGGGDSAASGATYVAPQTSDPNWPRQREALRLALQYPKYAGASFDDLEADEFTHPAYVAVRAAITAVGGASAAEDPLRWLSDVSAAATDDVVRALINSLAVEPPLKRDDAKGRQTVDARYVKQVLTAVRIDTVKRREDQLHSRLKRLDPTGAQDEYLALFAELTSLSQYRNGLRDSIDQ